HLVLHSFPTRRSSDLMPDFTNITCWSSNSPSINWALAIVTSFLSFIDGFNNSISSSIAPIMPNFILNSFFLPQLILFFESVQLFYFSLLPAFSIYPIQRYSVKLISRFILNRRGHLLFSLIPYPMFNHLVFRYTSGICIGLINFVS